MQKYLIRIIKKSNLRPHLQSENLDFQFPTKFLKHLHRHFFLSNFPKLFPLIQETAIAKPLNRACPSKISVYRILIEKKLSC